MISRFQQQMTRLTSNPAVYRYLLAVSGGADSMVMANLFLEAGYNFAIAHCNFHLRGEDSDRDMRFVLQWAAQHDSVCYVQEFDTLAEREKTGESVEMAARRLRYSWFEEIGQEYDYIVTAHQANDAAETILLNLMRGTGLKGLTGIPEKSGKLLRPLLSFTAEEIRTYAHLHEIGYVVDVTNADENIRRNRIRHTVIPALQTMNPQLITSMQHTSKVLQQQYGLYQEAVSRFIQTAVTQKGDTLYIHRDQLESHPFRETLLFEILRPYQFSEEVIFRVLEQGQTGRQFYAPQYRLLVDRADFLVEPLSNAHEQEIVCANMEDLCHYFEVEEHPVEHPMHFSEDNQVFYLPVRKLKFPVVLRHWKEGDFFYPLGAKGKKKLSDFFIDQKVNRLQKEQVLLFCIDDDIAWIVGYRSDERFKVSSEDTQYYKIQPQTSFFQS